MVSLEQSTKFNCIKAENYKKNIYSSNFVNHHLLYIYKATPPFLCPGLTNTAPMEVIHIIWLTQITLQVIFMIQNLF